MTNKNSKVDQTNSMEENELINFLKSFQPRPSISLSQKMEKAPWRIKPRLYRYAFQISVSVGIILMFIFSTPPSPPIFSSTNTPTQTHTTNPASFSTPDIGATPAPPDVSPSSTPIS